MQHAATTDPTGLAQIPQAPPLGLALGILFVLAIALLVFVMKRKNGGHELEPRQQGSPFVAAPAATRPTEHEPEPGEACCDVATAVRDYFSDPPMSVLARFSELIAQSQALARLREQLEADMEAKLEERFSAHREEMDSMLQVHQAEVQKLLTAHVLQVNKAISAENKNQTREVLEAVKALRETT